MVMPVPRQSLEISLTRISQLFNSLDPSPFYEKDLDTDAEEYLVSWAQELHHDVPLALTIHLKETPPEVHPENWITQAIERHFRGRAEFTRLELRRLLRQGRIALVIGLGCMALFLLMAQWIAATHASVFSGLLRESLTVAGWVAMWRPMQIYLYDWWPLRGRIRLYQRLSRMPVMVQLRTVASD
ncbi:MAG TPA: hypothetical protein VHE37_05205 [Nevskiaceae bacterium]|nr:hypothetical protein [Nevskiaceae bacterium]